MTHNGIVAPNARCKYPPVAVNTADLFGAMNTTDKDNESKTRGSIVIARKQYS